MMSVNLLVAVSIAYVAFLFLVAYVGDSRARMGQTAWIQSPIIYTLSISVYCTSWTFYGAVGTAARSGLDFATIYIGPTLVFVGWWWCLRKLVRIGRVHRITSIADLISSRYGKSPVLAVVVTLLAVTATTPYIALQLQSVTLSFEVISGSQREMATAFWVAAGMAAFTILFGTRTIDANERHHGVVAAIAVEAVVKLAALIAVGAFAIWGVAGGVGEVFERMPPDMLAVEELFGPRWVTLTVLSAAAILCLPRQFQVTVVENADERHLVTASWLFPLYLFLMSLFVVPIAIGGLAFLPAGSNPDLFVLSLPLALGRDDLALLAFIGGFSSATSMVIVAAIALSTMVSNHIVAPLAIKTLMKGKAASGDVRELLLTSRRASIILILGLGFLYFHLTGGSDALAAMGLIAFVGVAQILPAMIGGIFWRGATRMGALSGILGGSALWFYTLFLPSFGQDGILPASVLVDGPFGIALLRPQALLGLAGQDPLIHATIWSLGANLLLFVGVSALSPIAPLERLQGILFIDVFRSVEGESHRFIRRDATSEDLFVLAQRILGAEPARRLFDEMARGQGVARGLPNPTDEVIARLERELSGSVGAASAHAMVTRAAGGEIVSLTDLMDIADETQRLIETTARLADKTGELERTAAELRKVNERLRRLDRQKDDFLSQVSHELRTPMTSIRSFSEILLSDDALTPGEVRRFSGIIHDESLRLTRLLDEILDISRLESGAASIPTEPLDLAAALAGALDTVSGLAREAGVAIACAAPERGPLVEANPDRLRQVLINLLSNAIKHNPAAEKLIAVTVAARGAAVELDVSDNGGGVTRAEAEDIFAKFTRGSRAVEGQGAGLGLAISRAIMRRMGGELAVVFREDGTSFFRVALRRAAGESAGASAAAE